MTALFKYKRLCYARIASAALLSIFLFGCLDVELEDELQNSNASSLADPQQSIESATSANTASTTSIIFTETGPNGPALSWEAPIDREDGQFLKSDEIIAFDIIYRTVNADEYQQIFVKDPSVDRISIATLQPGNYEFLISAIDKDGLHSRYSEAIFVQL